MLTHQFYSVHDITQYALTNLDSKIHFHLGIACQVNVLLLNLVEHIQSRSSIVPFVSLIQIHEMLPADIQPIDLYRNYI